MKYIKTFENDDNMSKSKYVLSVGDYVYSNFNFMELKIDTKYEIIGIYNKFGNNVDNSNNSFDLCDVGLTRRFYLERFIPEIEYTSTKYNI